MPSPDYRAPHVRRFVDLDVTTLYALLRLRADVFVVEQACPYQDLDGRDTEPGTEHVWAADDAGPTGYLRVLDDGDARRVGRVCTRPDARGSGVAAWLVEDAVARHGGRVIVLDAQAYLSGFYARYGFTPSGPDFVEDGIPHTPMRRPPTA